MNFVKYNANPKGKKAGDCVIRAISKALNQSWEKTYSDLCELGLKQCMMPNDKRVFEKYLKLKGWVKCSEPRTWDNHKQMICQAVPFIKDKKLIIYAGSLHVTYVDNQTLYDTWDCRMKTMHTYWRKG